MHRLECFGRVAVTMSDGQDERLRSRKHLALLLYLAAHPRRSFSREALASLFWQTETRLARHSLSQALYDIRSKIPDLELQTTIHRIEYTGRGLAYDADRFEDALRDHRMSEAVELYDGMFAPELEDAGDGRFERWVEGERQRLRRLGEAVLCRYVALCDDRARWGEMRVTASRLLEMNPLNEEAHRSLMRSLWLQGDQRAALRHFEEHEAFLRRELPGGVDRTTRQLVERIRRSTVQPEEPLVKERPRAAMVGRAQPFGVLKRACRESRGGGGRVVLVKGEAGIGKSRLLEEFAEHTALEDVQLVESRCYVAESGVPYGPVVDGLAPIVARPDAAAGSPEGASVTYYQLGHLFPEAFGSPESGVDPFTARDAGRRRLHEETADLLRRVTAHRPIVWLLEDVHWIDDASAELVHYLGRRLAEYPFLLVATVRTYTDLGSASSKLLDGLATLENAVEIELGGLSAQQTRELVENLEGERPRDTAVRRIHRLSGGNPFLIVEIVRATASLGGTGPASVRDRSNRLFTADIRSLLNRRMHGLAPEAVRVLEVVAAAGRDARPGVVAESAGVPPEKLADLARSLYERGLLRDADERLEFAHDITREFVYSNLGDLQRAALHLALGEVLARSVHEIGPATMARHFQLGGDRPRAYRYALEAAEAAGDRHAHKEAADLARVALAQTRSPRQKADALALLYRAQLASGDLGKAQSSLEDLIGLGQLSPMETAAIRLDLARARLELASWEEALRQIEAVESALGEPSDTEQLELLLHALHLKLKVAIRRNQPARAGEVVSVIRDLEVLIAESGSDEAAAIGACSLGIHEAMFGSAEKGAAILAATRNLGPGVSTNLSLYCQLFEGIMAARKARWDHAEHTFREALVIAQNRNDTLLTTNLLNNLACCALEQGDWSEVHSLSDRAGESTATLAQNLYARFNPQINRINAYFYSGKARIAEEALESLLAASERIEAGAFLPDLLACKGLVSLQLGRKAVVDNLASRLLEMERDAYLAAQDRFKIAWFLSYICLDADLDRSLGMLEDAELMEEEADTASALKLRWLAFLFANSSEEDLGGPIGTGGGSGIKAQLSERGLTWFAYFSRRWLRQTMSVIRPRQIQC